MRRSPEVINITNSDTVGYQGAIDMGGTLHIDMSGSMPTVRVNGETLTGSKETEERSL